MIYYVVFAITLIVFVAFNAFIFPSAFLRFKRLPNFNERGAEYITEKKGKTIIYCPDARYRGYIKHYALSARSGKVIVKCEVAKDLRYIDYDIRMHDEKGKIFKTRNVKELIESEGYTQAVELDEKTAYVSIKVNRANNEIINGVTLPVLNDFLFYYFGNINTINFSEPSPPMLITGVTGVANYALVTATT